MNESTYASGTGNRVPLASDHALQGFDGVALAADEAAANALSLDPFAYVDDTLEFQVSYYSRDAEDIRDVALINRLAA